jgi:hypothetical protein
MPILRDLATQLEAAIQPGSGDAVDVPTNLAGISFQVTREPGAPQTFTLQALPGSPGSGRILLEAILGPLPPLLPDLPFGTLTLDVDAATNSDVLRFPLVGMWAVPLGITSLEISDVVATVTEQASNLTAIVVGRCTLGGQPTQVEVKLPGAFSLSGTLAPLDLLELVESLVGPKLQIPAGVPSVRLGASQFNVKLSDQLPSLVVHSSVDDFGDVEVVISKVDGEWESLAAFALPADWTFSKLAPLLAPLDTLKIEVPRLVFSSFSSDTFEIPNLGGVKFNPEVSKGLTFLANLNLQGGVLDFVSQLFGLTELPLTLAASDAISNSVIRARLAGSKDLLPGVLTIQNFVLGIRPEPLAFEPSAEARVEILGSELPRFRVAAGMQLGAGTPQLKLVTTDPWVNPAGIQGLTIAQTGLSLKATPPDYGVLGDVSVAGKRAELEVHFATSAPTFLKGEIPDRLALGDVVKDLVGLTIPTLIDMSIEDFKILVVAAPTDTITGEHYDPGLMLQGTFGIVGLDMFVKVRIDPATGVFAHGALKKKVEVGNVLVVSDAAGDGPPSMTLDTTGMPMLLLTGRLGLLGLSQSINAAVDASGFEAALDQDLGIAHYKVNARYRSPNDLRAGGECRYGIDINTGPIQLTPGTPSLGELKIDAGFGGSVTIEVVNQTFRGSVTGGFRWNDADFQIPPINLSVAPSSLAEIPTLVNNTIRDNAAVIFAAFLQDGGKWLKALADGLVKGVTNAAAVLRGVYNQTAQQIGDGLTNTLHKSADEVAQGLKAIGESPQSIASVLNNLGKPPEVIGNALKSIGKGANEVADALKQIGQAPEAIGNILHNVGFPDADIDGALKNVFPGLPDIGFPPHIKPPHIKPPHINHIKPPHVNHIKPPHVNHIKPPHVNHIKPPHINHIKPPHIKSPF